MYLLYVVAWLFAVQSNQLIGIDDRFAQAMSQFGEFFAIVSPALWFFATVAIIRTSIARALVLALGLAVLFPFPLFFGVTVA
jgi:Mn2+/Fe2+ NRAMP family transporter